MASDTFDAVLAEAERGTVWLTWESIRVWRDRLAAAHAAEVAERDARIAELEVACAQAVEFAQYVEDAAKGAMVARAKHYLSQPYAQELAARLARAEAAERDARELRVDAAKWRNYVNYRSDAEPSHVCRKCGHPYTPEAAQK